MLTVVINLILHAYIEFFILSCSTLFGPSLQLLGFITNTQVHISGSSFGTFQAK